MENTLGSLLSSGAAFESSDNTDEVLGVIAGDDDAELDIEEAIFFLRRYQISSEDYECVLQGTRTGARVSRN